MFFFGTPHNGFRHTGLEKAVGEENDSQKGILSQLKESSEYLENQKEVLGRLSGEFRRKFVTFYETKPTETDREVCRYHPNHAVLSCIFPPLCIDF